MMFSILDDRLLNEIKANTALAFSEVSVLCLEERFLHTAPTVYLDQPTCRANLSLCWEDTTVDVCTVE